MRSLANPYLAFELTGSATVLAAVALGQSLPGFFLGMFGGVIADRVKRRQLLMLTQTLIVLDSLLVTLLVTTGWIEVWHLALLAALHGSTLSFNQPARQAYMVELAGSTNVTQAVALYNSGQQSVRIMGPAIAGALISLSFVGIEGTYWVITAIYCLPVVSLFFIKARPEGKPRRRRAILVEFKDGISYIKNHEVLGILVLAGIVPPLLGNHYQQFLPVFASDKVLGVGASGLGLMATSTGIGAFLGAMAVANFGNIRRRGLVQLAAGATFGVSLILFGLSKEFAVTLACLGLVGFAASSYQTLNATLTLAASNPAYYGRVSAVQQVNNSMGSFVVLPIGLMVDSVGAPTMMIVTGTLIAIFWVLVFSFSRSYRRIELPTAAESEETRTTAAEPNAPAEEPEPSKVAP